MAREGKCSESVQSRAEVYVLKACGKHGPVIVQCTDSVVFPPYLSVRVSLRV